MAAPMRGRFLLSKVLSCSVPFSRPLNSLSAVQIIRKCSNEPRYVPTVFSGIQPTGVPHLGNYFGAVRPWVDLQTSWEGDIILSVVDLHSITVPQDPSTLRETTVEMLASLLACGIDPERTLLFQQSAVGQGIYYTEVFVSNMALSGAHTFTFETLVGRVCEHSELAWILGSLTTLPKLQHLPQWKEKSNKMKEVPLGLFTYPVLQAADILLYKATHVPVGDDQLKHIELARDLAKIFNRRFGATFPKPQGVVGNFKRIKSLRNPTSKMSKSAQDTKSLVNISDEPQVIRENIKKAVTDSIPNVTYDPENRPGVSNLVDIHAAFLDLTPEEICEQCQNLDTLRYKMLVADVVIEGLSRIRHRMGQLLSNKDYLEKTVRKGNLRAKEIAHENYLDIKRKVGLL